MVGLPTGLDGLRGVLRCPLCAGELTAITRVLTCPRGHTFDVARQGYVNLLVGRAPAGAETAAMVDARAALLAGGHFDFLTAAVADTAAELTTQRTRSTPPGLVIDVGAGTGHYLAAVLDRLPDHRGLALDVAKAATRRAARAHDRAAAAVCDAWRGLPLVDGCVDLVLDVFAPRNGAEFRRVLRPDGALIVVTPRPDHLSELVRALGLIGIDRDKTRRLDVALDHWFVPGRRQAHTRVLTLAPAEAALLVAMGPSSWHVDPADMAARLAELPGRVEVTASADLRVYHPRA